MPKANPIQTNFTSGEVSPLLRGRSDVDKYRNGAAEIYNCIVRTQGGVWRRPGTKYLGDAKSSDGDIVSMLYPFEFSDGQVYVLEFGGESSIPNITTTIRFWRDDELLLGIDNSDVPSGGAPITHGYITNVADNGDGTFEVTLDTSTNHTISNGDSIVIEGVVGTGTIESVNGEWSGSEVVDEDATKININTGETPSGTYANGGFFSEVPHVLGAPWTESEIKELSFAQSGDKLYIAHPSHQTRILSRVSAHQFELGLYDPDDGPYLSGDATIKTQKIGSIYNSTTLIAIEITNHGFTTGDRVTVRDTGSVADADGDWTITVVDDHNFTLDGSNYSNEGYDGFVDIQVELTMSALTDAATLIDTAATSPFSGVGTDNNKFIEVKWRGRWVLFKITDDSDTEEATVDYVEHGLYALDPSVVLKARYKNKFAGTGSETVHPQVQHALLGSPNRLQSNFSGVFTSQDINKYVRLTQSGGTTAAVQPTEGQTSVNWYSIDDVNYNATNTTAKVTVIASALDWNGTPRTWVIKGRTVTATVTSNTDFFASTDVGRWIRLNMRGIWVRGKITAQASATSVTVEIDWEFSEVPADIEDPDSIINDGVADTFKIGAWSDTTGWPGQVVFHEQRLTFARTDTEPQTLWMSVSGDFANMEPSEADGNVLDDSALTYTIASRKINPITSLQSNKVLLIGTEGGEWQARAASSISEPITPTNLSVTPQTNKGQLKDSYSQQVGPGVLFIQSAGQKVYDMIYSFDVDQWEANDVTIISEHILRKGTKGLQTDYQEEPVSIFWVRLSNGALAGLTFDRSQQVAAWHYHELGGTDTVINSIAVTRDPTGTTDALYMSVSRTINGGTEQYIEKLTPFVYPSSTSDKDNLFYVDSGITVVNGSPATSITGLDHLEGESVDVLADGVDVGPKTVSSGAITLDDAATTVQVGLNYVSRIETLPYEGGSAFGTSQGKVGTIPKIAVRFYLTKNVEVGDSTSNMVTQELTDQNLLFTGSQEFQVNHDYGKEPILILRQSAPYPMVVLAIYPQQWANE